MKTNWEVARAWCDGREARSGHMRTDGATVFSYALPIGLTVGRVKIALDYTASGGHFRSMTTSHHVYLVRSVAKHVYTPLAWEQWADYWGVR